MPKATTEFRPFTHSGVAAVFAGYPEKLKSRLMALRELIFDTAASIGGVGEIEETLRWGEPTYLTTASRTGAMIRINRVDPRRGGYAMYVHCQTNLIATFREAYPKVFTFEGNRAILFNEDDKLPVAELRQCIAKALTYRRDLKPSRKVPRATNSAE